MSYQAIITIMDRGISGKAVEAVTETGSHSGTLLKGRGSGLHEKQRILNVALEPEKDILLLVSKEENVDDIIQNIDEKIKITEPGNGLLVSMQVNRIHGMR
ncbi:MULTISPECIES: hypothetical protein [unclassified Jeotgalibaca]|uniref:hypothetical protein n=1 Tax=unclassified Jeotgalibaca TaxID=2621505 RepID=UPI003FD3D62B